MSQWRDTRPARPAGSYFVGGIEFKGGEADVKIVKPATRRLFEALGIVELEAPPSATVEETPGTPDDVAETVAEGDPEEAEPAESGDEPPAAEPPKRSRGAK